MNRISLAGIAKKAGVSRPVVFTVLKNRDGKNIRVSDGTRKKILKIAHDLGYFPPKSARDLFSGRTNTIGIIVHKLTPHFSALLEALNDHAGAAGLDVLPYIVGNSDEKEERCLNMLRDGRVDGVIAAAFAPHSESRYRKFSVPPYNLKIVSISPPIRSVPSVYVDEEGAGAAAAAHLTEIGCTRLCFFGVRETGRAKGFEKYLLDHGRARPIFRTGTGYQSFEDGGKLAAGSFLAKSRPDGVFAYNDLLGLALLREALIRGIRVPQELAIVGCDNSDVCRHTYPQLTSIDTSIPLTVKLALSKLLDLIKDRTVSPLHTIVPVSLVIRESTQRKQITRRKS